MNFKPKLKPGNASKRLERRMKRKSDREAKEIFESLSKGLQNLPAPGELPPLPAPGELPPLPIVEDQEEKQEIALPKLGDLPLLQHQENSHYLCLLVTCMLPILPGMPVPEKTVS